MKYAYVAQYYPFKKSEPEEEKDKSLLASMLNYRSCQANDRVWFRMRQNAPTIM